MKNFQHLHQEEEAYFNENLGHLEQQVSDRIETYRLISDLADIYFVHFFDFIGRGADIERHAKHPDNDNTEK